MKWWSTRSPEIDAGRKAAQSAFGDTDAIDLKRLAVVKVTIEGEKAVVRVDAEMLAADKKTGKPAAGFGVMHRMLHLIKEEGEWRVWSESSAEAELAASLVAARTDEEREKLLANDKDLVNIALRTALTDLGSRQRAQSNFVESIGICLLARGIAERIGDKLGILIATRGVAISNAELSRYDEALEGLRATLAAAEELGSKTQIAASLGNIGILYRRLANYDLAMQYQQKSLAMVEALGDKAAIARTLTNIGNVYYFQGNYAQAMEYLQKSLSIKEPNGDKADIAISLGSIANVYLALHDYPKALEHYQRALSVDEEAGNRLQVAQNLNNLASVYVFQGDYDAAMQRYEKSLSLFEAIGDRLGTSEALQNIAYVCNRKSNYQRALQTSERAASIAREEGLRELLWKACEQEGRAYFALKKFDEARRAFDEAISAIEALRADVAGGEQEQQQFFADRVSPYDSIVELLVAQNKPEEALAYAERKKARALLDVISNGRVRVTKAMTADEQEKERAFDAKLFSLNSRIARESARATPDTARLNNLKADLQKARLERDAFQIALYAAHPELKVKRGKSESLKLEDTRALLPDERSAVLEYVVTEEKTFLFVLSPELSATGGAARSQNRGSFLTVYTIPVKQADIAQRAEAFRQQLGRRDFRFGRAAADLYDVLLRPARAQLTNKSLLVIVPDDALWQLPFQALQPAENRFLLEDSAICYAPSLTVLREMVRLERRARPDQATRSDLLALGNPALGKQTLERIKAASRDEKLEPLPEAEREVRSLAQLYGSDRSEVFIGSEAREDRLKAEAGKFGVLHLATHGVIDDSSPMYSHLVLSQADGNTNEDGLLEAWEMMNLELKADLVVLSACETARGRLAQGEGVIGMSWALFVAGCPTVVVSEWKVDSASTTQLMLEFHKHLRRAMHGENHGMSVAKSLRESAVKMLHSAEYHHPFYWAGFVVIGAGLN
jgi:CHAT domain-containing protein